MTGTFHIVTNALFRHWNQYFASLPYNLNWQIKLNPQLKQYLSQTPLVVCDVGARDAAPAELVPFYPYVEYHAFEVDEAECQRLQATVWPYQTVCVFPYFIAGHNHTSPFRLYKRRGESSTYPPGRRFQQVFADPDFGVDREQEVQARTLDEVYSQAAVSQPDFIKLDTQGSELDILYGAQSVLQGVGLVEVEVEFIEMYEGQPLFPAVCQFMQKHDFELLYLNRVFGQRRKIFSGQSKGQLIFADALFGRREDCLRHFSPDRLIKFVLLLINYGHIDFAYHVIQLYPDIGKALPTLAHYFQTRKHGNTLKRALLSQIDKIALLLLFLRTYNQCTYDSDRSWPIR